MRQIDPKRILILGDIHGNLKRAKAAIHAAVTTECDAIVQVGDLGVLWPGDHPKSFDIPLAEELAKASLALAFVDGNHDSHTTLRNDFEPDESGFAEVVAGVWWAPRAHKWEWSGVTFGAMGGAYTVDREHRREGESIWQDVEEVSQADVDKLGSAHVDVLIAHEVPFGVPVKSTLKLEPRIVERSLRSRHLLRTAVENVRPSLVFSGHHHQRLSHDLSILGGTVRCEVLDMDGRFGNAVILNLPDLTIEEPPAAWHQWTRRSEKHALRKRRSDLVRNTIEQVAADGFEDEAARIEIARRLQGGSQ